MNVKIFILFATVLYVQNVFAHNQLQVFTPTQENNQELDTTAVENKKKDISYKLILEYGGSTGIERYYYKGADIEEMRTKYSWLGISLTAINNIAFKDRFLLGIGGGLEFRAYVIFPKELGATCFLNFRYYFNKSAKVVIPMLNIAIGGRMVREYGFFFSGEQPSSKMKYGVYSTLGAGIKVKRFSLQYGVLFWTKGYNLYGVDIMSKVGVSF